MIFPPVFVLTDGVWHHVSRTYYAGSCETSCGKREVFGLVFSIGLLACSEPEAELRRFCLDVKNEQAARAPICVECFTSKPVLCRWCGRTYEQHMSEPDPRFRARCPCGLLRARFMSANDHPSRLSVYEPDPNEPEPEG